MWVHWLTWRSGFKWEYPLCWGVSFKNLAASLGCGRRSRAPRLPSPRLSPPPVGLIFCLNPHRLCFPVACLCVQSYCYLTFRSAALGRIPGQCVMTPDRAALMTFSGNLSCRNSAPGLKLDVFAVWMCALERCSCLKEIRRVRAGHNAPLQPPCSLQDGYWAPHQLLWWYYIVSELTLSYKWYVCMRFVISRQANVPADAECVK